MGYYTEYFSTLLKSNWALSIKQRWDSKRVVRYSNKADILIYKKLPEEIEVQHRVTSALKDHDKAVEAIDYVVKYGLQLAFNSSYEDEVVLRTIKHLIENWEKIHEIIDKMRRNRNLFTDPTIRQVEPEMENLSKKFVLMIIRQAAKAEKEERGEMQDVMNLINEAHKTNHEQLLTRAKSTFSSLSSQTRLASLALRWDIRHEKKLIIDLERLSVKLEEQKKRFDRILKNVNATQHELPKILGQFKQIIEASEKDIEGAFLYSYKIKKRDFRLMLAIMVNAEVLKKMDLRYIRMHFLPELPTYQRIKDIDNVEQKLAQKLHIVAQALRISVNANQDIKRKVMPLAA